MLPIRNQNNGSPTVGRRIISLAVVALFLGSSVSAQNQGVPDISRMSIEELMNVEVTSVAKRPQRVADAAAAVFVITQEDIRRSGAASIPEALRMVPGLQVARIDENKWAIGSRGFNGRFDNKLLVLIDGRSVYTPLFSGVYWNVQDVMLEDVDRIEVIRGPGATLWGANAVDGVINVITKKAKATQSAIVTAGAGTEETSSGGGIILPRDPRCRCRCITTIRRLPTILFSATIKTFWTSISSTDFMLATHSNLSGDWATGPSTTRTTPASRFPCSLTRSR